MMAWAMRFVARDGRAPGEVLSLDRARIERALRTRQRYRYVHPRLEATPSGWKVFSRNCSRSVDAQGGEIDIAWLRHGAEGWSLYARDHAARRWVQRLAGATLPRLLQLLCEDPNREFWP
jgi:hypothetical protein